MSEDRALFEDCFWHVCRAEFPAHEEALREVLKAGLNSIERGAMRAFERAGQAFFQRGSVTWPRYERHRQAADPPERGLNPGEEDEPGPDYREMGRLLAHRIVTSYYMEGRLARLRDNIDSRPVWRLQPVGDGRTPPECIRESEQAHHWRSAYWTNKVLPCERLECRCRIAAMTISEAAAEIARSGVSGD